MQRKGQAFEILMLIFSIISAVMFLGMLLGFFSKATALPTVDICPKVCSNEIIGKITVLNNETASLKNCGAYGSCEFCGEQNFTEYAVINICKLKSCNCITTEANESK